MPDQETLTELFARDPFSYTKEDIDRIIKHYAEARKNFNLGGPKATKEKQVVNLAELGL